MDNNEMMRQISDMFKEQNYAISKTIKDEVSRLDARIDGLDTRIDGLDSRVDGLDARLARVEITLENEIRDGMRLLAEGQATIIDQLSRLNGLPERVEALEKRADWHESEIRELRKAL